MAKELAWVDWDKCIELANKRLRDVITAANKADDNEMAALMLCSMCGDESEFKHYNDETVKVLDNYAEDGLCYTYRGHRWHISIDKEFTTNKVSDIYHVWCCCNGFDGEEVPCGEVHVGYLFGAEFLERECKAFLTGKISKLKLGNYIYRDTNYTMDTWLEKNEEKIYD